MSPMEQLAKQEYERGYSDGKSDFFAAGVAEGEMRARQRMIANRVAANQHPFAAPGKPIDHIADTGKMIGCAYCDNPLFAGTKCNNCGRVTLAEPVKQEPVTLLPDGSAFAVLSYPLPKDHWLYAERQYAEGADEPIELGKPVLTHALRAEVVSAIRYAIRGATNCGKEVDFDPDALVQNAVYALCGPYGPVAQQEPVAVVKKSLTTELLTDALTSILKMDVKGYELQERLQFSTSGRQLLEKAKNALSAPVQPVKHEVNQEPVAWRYNSNGDWIYKDRKVWDAAEPLYAAPVQPVKQEPVMDNERIFALREAERNGSEHNYFNARPHNDTPTLRGVFCQGFDRGFNKGLKYASPVERQWVDLTDDELKAALEVHQVGLSVRIGRIAIAAFKDKNK